MGWRKLTFIYLQNISDNVEGDPCCWKLHIPLKLHHFPREDHSSYNKPGFGHQRYSHFQPRTNFPRRDHFQSKHQRLAQREREKEKERYEQRESSDGSSLPQQNSCKFMFAAKTIIIHTMIMQPHTCLFPFNIYESVQIHLHTLLYSQMVCKAKASRHYVLCTWA